MIVLSDYSKPLILASTIITTSIALFLSDFTGILNMSESVLKDKVFCIVVHKY